MKQRLRDDELQESLKKLGKTGYKVAADEARSTSEGQDTTLHTSGACSWQQLITWVQWWVRMVAKWICMWTGRNGDKMPRRYTDVRRLLLAKRRLECEE